MSLKQLGKELFIGFPIETATIYYYYCRYKQVGDNVGCAFEYIQHHELVVAALGVLEWSMGLLCISLELDMFQDTRASLLSLVAYSC